MEHRCENCGHIIKIPDAKVPKGKSFTIGCPECKHKNKIEPGAKPKEFTPDKSPAKKPQEQASPIEDIGDDNPLEDKPFEFIDEGVDTALVCEADKDLKKRINSTLDVMNFHITSPDNPREALKEMRFREFDLVVLNERFGSRDPESNYVLKHIHSLSMFVRRDMFVALLTDRFTTLDNMAAYNRSVNLVVNVENMNQFDKILKRGIDINLRFYRVLKETMAKHGRT